MGFLDNLENNLKALENQEERDPEKVKRDRDRREADRNAALLRAPHVEALKKSPFTSDLLTQCRTLGNQGVHGQRVLVQFTWIGENLRLDARLKLPEEKSKRLELIPTAEGIVAAFSVDGVETAREPVDPQSADAAALAQRWLLGQ